MRELCFELLDTTEALERFVPRWVALCTADANATPFQHPAWLLQWWRQFGSDALCAVAVFSGTLLLALLPLYIYTESATGQRKLMLLGVGTSDYLDGVFAPECTAEDLRRALCWLAARRSWDVFVLVQVRSASLMLKAMGQLGASRFATEPCSSLPALSIENLPVKIRRNAMYYGNVARRRGTLKLTVAGASNCLEQFDALVRLHTKRWQQRDEGGVLADPRVLAWHREALPLLANAGLLRLYTLALSGVPIAVLYALVDRPGRTSRTAYFYLPGFSTEHSDLRPGTLLMAAAMEQAASEGVVTIDLLRGDEPYKQHWHAMPMMTHGSSLPYQEIRKLSAVEQETFA